jgi:hypothetical protein
MFLMLHIYFLLAEISLQAFNFKNTVCNLLGSSGPIIVVNLHSIRSSYDTVRSMQFDQEK